MLIPEKILVTGGLGFIGSTFVRRVLERWPKTRVINLDAITYAGNPENLKDVEGHSNYEFIHGDIREAETVLRAMDGCDVVAHFAAESHVDRSILESDAFMTTNIMGTHVLVETARKLGLERFVFVSTDEVYGSLEAPEVADEQYKLEPNSPYSVSKTAADMLVRACFVTHGFPGIITRASNNFGPYQFPEKLIPLFVTNLLDGKKVPVYGDGQNVRDWILASDHADGIARVIEDGQLGETYNIGGTNGHTNLEITHKILELCGKDESSIEYVKDRPGHDRRYAIDSSKLEKELGWKPQRNFEDDLAMTVEWYRENRNWWERIKSGEYRNYYKKQYGAEAGAAS